MNLGAKQKRTHRQQICSCQGERGEEGWTGSLGLVDANYYTCSVINNKVLTYSTGKDIQYPVIKV